MADDQTNDQPEPVETGQLTEPQELTESEKLTEAEQPEHSPEPEESTEPEESAQPEESVQPDQTSETKPARGLERAPDEPAQPARPKRPRKKRQQPRKAASKDTAVPVGDNRFRPVAPSGAKRIGRAMTKRPQASHVGVGLLVGLLGFAAVVQVRGDEDDTLAHARRDELLQIYDGLSRQGDRLEDEINELRSSRQELINSADSESVALDQAEERLRQSEVIAGTAPATGPGIQMTISDPLLLLEPSVLFGALQELRSAGAEAIQIEGVGSNTTVRVVTDTNILDAEGGLLVSGVELQPPYVMTALGNPVNLEQAMNFPDGVVSKIGRLEAADATITQLDELTVDALHEVKEPEYLRPAPEEEE